MSKNKAQVKELQTLCGYLNFLNRVIFPGRVFVRRMYAKYESIINPKRNPSGHFKFRQYHHVKLNAEFKADCHIWLEFLTNPSINEVVNRPMVDFSQEVTGREIRFYSDASAAVSLGFRCMLNMKWIVGQWNAAFMRKFKPSIEYLELFALTAGILSWENEEVLNNTCVVIFCDNQAVIDMVNNITSGCKNYMVLLRLLVLNRLLHNRRLQVCHVRSKDNGISDALSILQYKRFWALAPEMNKLPDMIDERIWPLSKI